MLIKNIEGTPYPGLEEVIKDQWVGGGGCHLKNINSLFWKQKCLYGLVTYEVCGGRNVIFSKYQGKIRYSKLFGKIWNFFFVCDVIVMSYVESLYLFWYVRNGDPW